PKTRHSFPTRRSSDLAGSTSRPVSTAFTQEQTGSVLADRDEPIAQCLAGGSVIVSQDARQQVRRVIVASCDVEHARAYSRIANLDRKSTRLNSSHVSI